MSGTPRTVTRDQFTLNLSPSNPPVIEVEAGEEVLFEAPSAMGGIIQADGTPSERTEWANPAAGPVSVKSLGAGETAAVFIHEIAPVGYGMAGGRVYVPCDGQLDFLDGLRVPIEPSIGTIGVAPAAEDEATDNMRSGAHGGNMDCRDVTPGSVLFLKARIDGGMLGMGDVHLAMGDGEVEGQGVEAAADIRVSIRKTRPVAVEWPWLVRNGEIMAIGAHSDYSSALHIAYEALIDLCRDLFGADREEVRARIAPAGWVKVCQTCCEVKTVRVSLPLELFGLNEERFLAEVLV